MHLTSEKIAVLRVLADEEYSMPWYQFKFAVPDMSVIEVQRVANQMKVDGLVGEIQMYWGITDDGRKALENADNA